MGGDGYEEMHTYIPNFLEVVKTEGELVIKIDLQVVPPMVKSFLEYSPKILEKKLKFLYIF